METRNLKRNEQDKKANSKITDRGDHIKVTEKLNQAIQRITNTLLQADRGDSKLRQTIKAGKENFDTKCDVKRNKSVKDTIFQSNKGSLELKRLKPSSRDNSVRTDIVKSEKGAPSEEDNAIRMDREIKQFLKKDNGEVRVEKLKYLKNDTKNNDAKKHTVDIETKRVLNANERKKIREKYTIRTKAHPGAMATPNLLQNESSNICNGQEQGNKLADSKSESTKTVKDSESKKSAKSNRKPVITTIRSKNNTKVYKTVTFTDFKADCRLKPIQIKIPAGNLVKRKEDYIPVINTPMSKEMCYKTESSSNKGKSRKRSHKTKGRHTSSPEPVFVGDSPPTEVAKWAPNCISKQTKPYYEAWVDTTLAAITKLSKKDKMLLEKQNLVTSFKRMLERPDSPDLVLNNMDEKYFGKIKIRQR